MAASDGDAVEQLADLEHRFLITDSIASGLADDDTSAEALALRAGLETTRRELREIKGLIARGAFVDPLDWYKTQLRRTRRRCRELERTLLEERRRAWTFTDDAVAAALTCSYKDKPVSAGSVARRMVEAPTHSMLIRVGGALSRLAAAGQVERLAPADTHGTCRWAPRSRALVGKLSIGAEAEPLRRKLDELHARELPEGGQG